MTCYHQYNVLFGFRVVDVKSSPNEYGCQVQSHPGFHSLFKIKSSVCLQAKEKPQPGTEYYSTYLTRLAADQLFCPDKLPRSTTDSKIINGPRLRNITWTPNDNHII